jgi:ferredoxin--NADP+ reductase
MLKTGDAWDSFERIILVHGARNTGELNYGETIAELQAAQPEKFTFITALTREEQRDGALQGRITNCWSPASCRPRPNADINADDSHLMLCGNSAMIKDVRAWLEARGMQRHKRHEPGHYTTEQYH